MSLLFTNIRQHFLCSFLGSVADISTAPLLALNMEALFAWMHQVITPPWSHNRLSSVFISIPHSFAEFSPFNLAWWQVARYGISTFLHVNHFKTFSVAILSNALFISLPTWAPGALLALLESWLKQVSQVVTSYRCRLSFRRLFICFLDIPLSLSWALLWPTSQHQFGL